MVQEGELKPDEVLQLLADAGDCDEKFAGAIGAAGDVKVEGDKLLEALVAGRQHEQQACQCLNSSN